MLKEYTEFFEQFLGYLEEQRKQKMRGLNDYNMVNVVRKENHEVGMHSNVIFSLIDPNGLHYQEDLFLKLFIKTVLEPKLGDTKPFGDIISVHVEESTNDNRRIDFTIKSSNYLIGIEMKIDAEDLPQQIFDCNTYLENEASQSNGQTVQIFYLTKEGKDASTKSKYSKDGFICVENIKNISFRTDIIDWITCCQEEVKNIVNLNVALENYKSIVKKITNQYKGNVMALEDYLLDDNLNMKNIEFSKILDEIEEMNTRVVSKVEEAVQKRLATVEFVKLNDGLCIEFESFLIKFIIDDRVIIQIADKEQPFQNPVDRDKKEKLVKCLQKVDSGFNRAWNKAYAALDLGKLRMHTQGEVLGKLVRYFEDIRTCLKENT